jgi:signal transduction histidine kinase
VDIIDDGKGIPPNPTKGYGLNNMQRRAQIIAAKLSLQPFDSGTKIQLWLPSDVGIEGAY